jgi:hypothetical protein
LPAAFILAGAGIGLLARDIRTMPVGAVIAILFAGYSAPTLNAYYRGARSDWRSIARYVHDRVDEGEPILAANDWVFRNFGHYWRQLPPVPGVNLDRFQPWHREFYGPAWIVSGQCFAREPLKQVTLLKRFPETELSEVRRLREGERLPMNEEICPH